ncbi:hypothetical protein [Kitasatospora sp. NPDC047058]|uniref:hypothetical protein n=1 Tax=Kitasatospora sp. NPDC047058 TaxID=3155620 RepID=UPI003409618E
MFGVPVVEESVRELPQGGQIVLCSRRFMIQQVAADPAKGPALGEEFLDSAVAFADGRGS